MDIPAEVLLGIELHNYGEGMKTEAGCQQLADNLERLLADRPAAVYGDPTRKPYGPEGDAIRDAIAGGWQYEQGQDGYFVEVEQVREFIAFLRECKGFGVW